MSTSSAEEVAAKIEKIPREGRDFIDTRTLGNLLGVAFVLSPGLPCQRLRRIHVGKRMLRKRAGVSREPFSLSLNVKAIVLNVFSNDPIMADYKRFGFKGVISKPYRQHQRIQQNSSRSDDGIRSTRLHSACDGVIP